METGCNATPNIHIDCDHVSDSIRYHKWGDWLVGTRKDTHELILNTNRHELQGKIETDGQVQEEKAARARVRKGKASSPGGLVGNQAKAIGCRARTGRAEISAAPIVARRGGTGRDSGTVQRGCKDTGRIDKGIIDGLRDLVDRIKAHKENPAASGPTFHGVPIDQFEMERVEVCPWGREVTLKGVSRY